MRVIEAVNNFGADIVNKLRWISFLTVQCWWKSILEGMGNIYISLYLSISAVLFNSGESISTIIHEQIVSSSVSMSCPCNVNADRHWKFMSTVVYLNRILMDGSFARNLKLQGNYSLLVNDISVKNEGYYSCGSGKSISSSHLLIVQGSASLTI